MSLFRHRPWETHHYSDSLIKCKKTEERIFRKIKKLRKAWIADNMVEVEKQIRLLARELPK